MPAYRRTVILALAFLGLTFVYFAKPLILGQAFTRGDIGALFYPHRLFLAHCVRDGEVPLWNPLIFCGVPYFANPLNSFFYPPNWLFVAVPRPATVWLLLMLHLSLGGVGVVYLAREMMKTDWWPAFCGGCVYAFSGYWCMHMGHFTQVLAGAWTPWVCWAAVRWFRGPCRRSFCLLVALLAVQLVPGGPENVAYLYWTLFLLAVVSIVAGTLSVLRPREVCPPESWRDRALPGLGLLGAMAMALAVSALQVLPALEHLSFSFRWGGMAHEYAGKQSIPLWKPLVELIIPNYGGHYGATPYVPTELLHPETVGYVGPVAVLLAALAAVKQWQRPAVRVCVLLTLAALLLAFGRNTPFYQALYHLGLSMFRNPARAIYLVALGEAVLCAAGLQYLLGLDALPLKGRRHRWIAAGLAAAGMAILAPVALPGALGLFQRHTLPWLYAGDVAATFLAISIGYQALTLRPGDLRRAFVFLSIVAPLFLFVRESEFHNLPRENPQQAQSKGQVLEAVRERIGPYRVYSRHWFIYQTNEMVGHGLPEATGMHSGLRPLRRFWELQQRMTPESHLASTEGRRFLDLLGARFLLYDHAAPEGEGRLLAHHEPYRVYENQYARPRLSFVLRGIVLSDEDTLRLMAEGEWQPSEEVLLDQRSAFHGKAETPADGRRAARITIDRANTVACEVLAPTQGFLVLTDTYYPGWEVLVDGEPAELLRANYLFRAVALAPGAHLVEFRYRPQSLTAGVALSAASLLALLLILRWKRKPGPGGEGRGSVCT